MQLFEFICAFLGLFCGIFVATGSILVGREHGEHLGKYPVILICFGKLVVEPILNRMGDQRFGRILNYGTALGMLLFGSAVIISILSH